MKEIKAQGLYDTDINKHNVIRYGERDTHTHAYSVYFTVTRTNTQKDAKFMTT